MKKMNTRIIKKLSQKSALLLPNVEWSIIASTSKCDVLGDILANTPTMELKTSPDVMPFDSVCAWVVLKKLFEIEKERALWNEREWFWGTKSTPENVLFWAEWESLTLSNVTNNCFEDVSSIDDEDE